MTVFILKEGSVLEEKDCAWQRSKIICFAYRKLQTIVPTATGLVPLYTNSGPGCSGGQRDNGGYLSAFAVPRGWSGNKRKAEVSLREKEISVSRGCFPEKTMHGDLLSK